MIVRELISLVGFKVDKAAMNRASNAARQLGSKMQSVGRTMSMALTAPIVGLGISMTKIAGDFEASMNRVMVLTNATGEQFAMLRNQARELGATTAFSAKEAADAMGFLAQAGFDTNEIFQAMPATLNLAAAAKQDLATTADQLSNIMQAFQLKTSDAGHASDVLALASSSTNTNVSQLAEAMKYAAPDAHALGLTMEETAGILGFMGNAGIQASMAGTGLRMALKQLLDPGDDAIKVFEKLNVSIYQVGKDGKKSTRNIIDVLQDLQDAGASPLDMNTIFGIRASTGTQVVMGQTVASLKELVVKLRDFADDTALRQQEIQMEGLNGAIKALKSAYGELAIAVGDAGLLGNTTKFTEKITTLIRELAKSDPEKLELFTKMAGFAAALPVAIWGLGGLTSAIVKIMANPAVAALAVLVAGLAALEVSARNAANDVPVGTSVPLYRAPKGKLGKYAYVPNHESIADSVARDYTRSLPQKGQGSFLPQVTINNETSVHFDGSGMNLTTGEISETIQRATETALNDTLSRALNNFPKAK